MLLLSLFAASITPVAPPLVPGGCTEQAADHQNEAGCYLLAEFKIEKAPPKLYWYIAEFPSLVDAEAAARGHRWSRAVSTHGRFWLLVIGDGREHVDGGTSRATIGPMSVPPGDMISIRFLTSNFPPGMRTRVHSHPGSEAFYVIEGEQCVETPTARHRVAAGHSYVVQGGLHMQAAANGRKSLVALILRSDAVWSRPEIGWTPSNFCAH